MGSQAQDWGPLHWAGCPGLSAWLIKTLPCIFHAAQSSLPCPCRRILTCMPCAAHAVAPAAVVVEAGGDGKAGEGHSHASGSCGGSASSQQSPSAGEAPCPASSQRDLSYRDALTGGRAPAAAADEMRSPRTPGGSHIPVTVSRNAAATTAQHSPTILAQSGYTARHDPFSSPLRPQEGAGSGATTVPRKISFDYFSPAAASVPAKAPAPVPVPSETKVCSKGAGRGQTARHGKNSELGLGWDRWLLQVSGHWWWIWAMARMKVGAGKVAGSSGPGLSFSFMGVREGQVEWALASSNFSPPASTACTHEGARRMLNCSLPALSACSTQPGHPLMVVFDLPLTPGWLWAGACW